MPSDRLLSVAQVAARLGVAPFTVKRWARDGAIPSIKLSSGTRRFDPVELEAWIAAHREPVR